MSTVLFDGEKFAVLGGAGDYAILDQELREVATRDDIRCIPSPRALYSESGRYNCRFTETLQTLDLRDGETYDSAYPSRGFGHFGRVPGRSADRYVARSQDFEVEHLFLVEDIVGRFPRVFAAGELVPLTPPEQDYWSQNSAVVYMDGDELIGHWGERYDVSPDCAEEGACFEEISPRGDQLYALGAPGADGSVLLAPDDRGFRTSIERREFLPPCSRCEFERWGPEGERQAVEIGLPPFEYDNDRISPPTFFDDPWEGGAWILVRGVDVDEPRRRIIELYKLPL